MLTMYSIKGAEDFSCIPVNLLTELLLRFCFFALMGVKMVPPVGSEDDPVTAITTKFVKTVYNKQRCPIFCTSVSGVG